MDQEPVLVNQLRSIGVTPAAEPENAPLSHAHQQASGKSKQQQARLSADQSHFHRLDKHHHRHPRFERHSNGAIKRQWSDGIEPAADDGTFTIMTYNLLANSLAISNSFLYSYCKRRHLDYNYRGPLLIREILARRLSVYCFQELDMKDYSELFEPTMRAAGYKSFFIKRTGSSKFDGCALFYRRDQVHAVSIKGVEYRHNTYTERENVGIVALLDIKDGSRRRRVCVATTHVLFNPRRGFIKLAQLRYLLNVARATVAAEDQDIPTILCGDMNAFPESLVFDYLATSGVRLTCVPESSMSGQQGFWDKNRSQSYNEELVREFEQAFAAPSVDEVMIAQDFVVKHRDQVKPATASPESPIQVISPGNISPSMRSSSSSSSSFTAAITNSTVQFSPGMSACMYRRQVESTIMNVTTVTSTFDYLPQHFDFKSAYWNKQFKRDSIRPLNHTIIYDNAEAGSNVSTAPTAKDKHCHNGWTTHHGRCQAVCDYIFYGNLRPEARIKTRQELFRIGLEQGGQARAMSEAFDDNEQRDSGPRYLTKLVPTAILELPCALISSMKGYQGLPGSDFGSDHLSLATKFKFEDEQTVTDKAFSQEQLHMALKQHYHPWTYSTPALPEAPELPEPLTFSGRPHARYHHDQQHYSRRTHSHHYSHHHEHDGRGGKRNKGSHDREGDPERQRDWIQGRGRGRGRGQGRGHGSSQHYEREGLSVSHEDISQ